MIEASNFVNKNCLFASTNLPESFVNIQVTFTIFITSSRSKLFMTRPKFDFDQLLACLCSHTFAKSFKTSCE